MLSDLIRATDFPTLQSKVYLNTAAEGIPPQAVLDALTQYGQDKLLGMDGRPLHEAQWMALREQAGKAFGLSAEEVGVCSCSSEAFSLAQRAAKLQPGDEVIINDLDFPAGATPWLVDSCPATVRVWKNRDGVLHLDDLDTLVNEKTKVFSTSLVSFYNGFKLPLKQAIETVRAKSAAYIFVDVTQALGHVSLDLSEVDLVISSTHKWILSSHGGGLVGIPKKRAAELTAEGGGWFNVQNAFDADRFEHVVQKQGAESFMLGMPNYPAVYAIRAGLAYVQSVGIEAIEKYTADLTDQCFAAINAMPVEMLTPDDASQRAGIVSFKHEKGEAIAAHLREKDIHLMSQAGRLRVSIHGYNTQADIDKLTEGLNEAIKNV